MIKLSNVQPVTLRKAEKITDNTENGYLTIKLNETKSNTILLSRKAVSSLKINVDTLSKDNPAYLGIYPEIDNNAEEFTAKWFISQFDVPADKEERKKELANTIKTGKYKAYKLAKFNKTGSNINSAIMREILKTEFNEENIILVKVPTGETDLMGEPIYNTDKYELMTQSNYEEINASSEDGVQENAEESTDNNEQGTKTSTQPEKQSPAQAPSKTVGEETERENEPNVEEVQESETTTENNEEVAA